MSTRFMTGIMCDDVRQETGNKLSYMGIYFGSIIVPQFPYPLPKLCFVMDVIFEPPDVPPASVKFRLYRDAEILNESTVTNEVDLSSILDRHQKRGAIRSISALYPLLLTGPGFFRIRAVCEDRPEEELKGGAWEIQQLVQPSLFNVSPTQTPWPSLPPGT